MSARAAIFDALKAAGAGDPEAVAARFAQPPQGPIPARAKVDGETAVADFMRRVEAAAATVERLPNREALPAAVAAQLKAVNAPARLRHADHPLLNGLDWGALEVSAGAGRGEDAAALSVAICGIAETGTLMMRSGADSPTTLNFLPDLHFAVVEAGAIAGGLEDAFARLRALGETPRTVNFITGPSRSADIEQTLQLGAHGPRRLHVLILG